MSEDMTESTLTAPVLPDVPPPYVEPTTQDTAPPAEPPTAPTPVVTEQPEEPKNGLVWNKEVQAFVEEPRVVEPGRPAPEGKVWHIGQQKYVDAVTGE